MSNDSRKVNQAYAAEKRRIEAGGAIPDLLGEAGERVIDTLSQPPTVGVLGCNLRPGMILVDDLGCPCASIDRKIGRAADSVVTFLVHDLDRGGHHYHGFHVNKSFRIVAK
jgi:hypothetical protein